jgi:hypothetical protein
MHRRHGYVVAAKNADHKTEAASLIMSEAAFLNQFSPQQAAGNVPAEIQRGRQDSNPQPFTLGL